MSFGNILEGKKGLIVGIANDKSIAYGCGKAFREAGADLAITYLNDKAKPHVEPLAKELDAEIFMPCNVAHEGELEAVYQAIEEKWGKLDFILHSIAFCPADDLNGRVVDSSKEGFAVAMDISCHSYARMAKLAEPLMKDGGCCLAVSYFGAEMVVENYNLMGPVKSALEALNRYMAAELGKKGIRAHTLSPGPIMTRAGSGIGGFDEIYNTAIEKTPGHKLATQDDVGATAVFLVSDAAKAVNGENIHIDGGYHNID